MKIPAFFLVACALLLTSCATTSQHSVTPVSLKHDQIIVVGKFTLTPSLQYITFKGDVNPNTRPESEGTIEKNFGWFWTFLTTSEKMAALSNSANLFGSEAMGATMEAIGSKSTYDYAINNETMILPATQGKQLYLIGFRLGYDGSSGKFPVNYTIQVPEGAKAIYIGTFAFTRNKYLQATGFKHIDEYDQALEDFHKVFPNEELVRADVSPTVVKPKDSN